MGTMTGIGEFPETKIDTGPSEELRRRFTRHEVQPETETAAMLELARRHALAFAAHVERHTPPGRERANAITAIEEALMWANKAAASQPAANPRTLTMEALPSTPEGAA